MKAVAIFIIAAIAVLLWDWQANHSRHSDAFVRMTIEIKRNLLGR